MTNEDLLQKLTDYLGKSKADALAPVVKEYGPAFLLMTEAEIWAWLTQAVKGNVYKSYGDIVSRLPNSELGQEWDKMNVSWAVANKANADAVAWQRNAASALLSAFVTIATSLVAL